MVKRNEGITGVSKLRTEKMSKKKKNFLEYEQTRPEQLTLFEMFSADEKKYSNTIELYDFMPKYVWDPASRDEEKSFEPIMRNFDCRGENYGLTIHPVQLRMPEGGFKVCFLGRREEVVEDALRKMVADGKGVFLDNQVGLKFSLYALRKELAMFNHTCDNRQIKNSLQILKMTNLELIKNDGKKSKSLFFSPIETLGFEGEDDETNTFVRFSPLVTHSICEASFRMCNYQQIMSYKSAIARQLHKRMSHNYIQADITNSFEVKLSTLIRDFGLTPQKRIKYNLKNFKTAFDEMIAKKVILDVRIAEVYDTGKNNKVVDVMISIKPTVQFSNEAKKFNHFSNVIVKKLTQL